MSRARLEEKHFRLPARELVRIADDARAKTLELVGDLEDDQLSVPHRDILNPPLWELGHVAFFWDTFVLGELDGREPMLDHARELYDSFAVGHDTRWNLPLPSRGRTLRYMNDVHTRVTERLHDREPSAVETYLFLLCALHEDMHGEAFTYSRQTLEYAAPRGLLAGRDGPGRGPLAGDVEVPGGRFCLGAAREAPFVFDNEMWTHPLEVAPFAIARAPVTNAEFAEFVEAGGYRRPELWSHQGRVWRAERGATRPIYWHRDRTGWLRRRFDVMAPLEEHAPVCHVSWYEAEAYCKWRGRRLPSEAEWEMAATATPGGGKRRYPWGDELPRAELANLDGSRLGCVDVAAHAAGDSAFGCRQMAGNVWEWTASSFYPFPGYLVDHPYAEYSAPWFGTRKVLKGGAWATRSRLAWSTYRNFFEPGRNDVIAGFRTCARR